MSPPRIYVASRTRHAEMWLRARRSGSPIISTWIDEAGPGESASIEGLWLRCISEASSATALVAFHADGDVWKGAFIEIGAALSSGLPVYVVGNPPGSWTSHPLVCLTGTVEEALVAAGRCA